ncbi:N-acetylneuraminate synthase [Candidatus Pelagibacter sp.]|nr:N-acetylneuraminate synthase [Candidatus Pelagibacter sp.]
MEKTIIIAEAGVNHNGSIKLAKKLIDIASRAGADYIKFQSFKTELVFSKNTPKAAYQAKNTSKKTTALEMGKKLELSEESHLILKKYCTIKNIKYLTTFHDLETLKQYKKFNLDFIKIGSGDINNLPYLQAVSKIKKKIILSSGLSNLRDIQEAIKILTKGILKRKDIIVLHCNSAYPTPLEDVNLNVLTTLQKKLKIKIGYSDHTQGIEVSTAAVSMGAKVIEKHFTINKKLPGPDHKASLDPKELSQLVDYIRKIDTAKGRFIKIPTKSELINKHVVRKSIVAIKEIKIGDRFTKANIFVKRPSTGMSPMSFDKLLGKKSKKYYSFDQLIKEKI